ncbi:ABC transporter ATP-binding protein [Acuticoccus mangrovi]|uniref:ABC transporter ATP-binding protein n=1 Tax=Acuticoccus mangrovi TaxID=2796142 RepID=A0A934MNY6_9HYPH|nr:ABC transporter ATP-binding protein [Acuticoccus mangrovi]MBJ3778619.1 ABC transporter ATP-binding protein [Acuticoccus mangrovi]
MTAAPYIHLAGLDKVYRSGRGDVTALQGIDLDVHKGEFVSILGPSGCGKSTLLKCVAGLEPITGGTVEIAGEAVRQPPANTGFVFQRDVLLDWRTVLDNVLLPAEFRRLNRADWRPRALQLLADLGLDGYGSRYPWELSGGMRQRVAICRGLLLDPELLLMDEPFGALDAITRDELNMELERIWEKSSKTVLFITHSIAEAVFLSSRVIVMARQPGRIADVVDIDLPRPRTLALRETPEFTGYTRRLRSTFELLGIMKKSGT